MAKIRNLRRRHPEYDRERLALTEALYAGGREWRKRIDQVLPQNHKEPSDVWRDRKAQAAYFNHMGGLINLVVGHLFSEPSAMEGGGTYWDQLRANCDGHGTAWDDWWAGVLLDALLNRRSFAYVNIPAKAGEAEGADNLAAQIKGGQLDAFLVSISGADVIDWAEDPRGNLLWMVTETKDWQRKAPDQPSICVWRWTFYSADRIQAWEWYDPQGKQRTPPEGGEAPELFNVAHGYGVAPVVRLELPVGLWMGDKLHDPALHLCRRENDLDWALYKAAHALLFIKSQWGDDATPTLGPGYYLPLDSDAEIGYAEPSGRNFEILRQRVKDLREELYRVVQAMAQGLDSSASRSAQSAESKGMDWRASEILLSAFASLTLDAMAKAAAIAGGLRQEKPPTFSGLNTGEEEDLDAFLERAAASIDARELSPTFRKVVARREAQRLLADEVEPEQLQIILNEIDAAVVEPAGVFQPTPGLDDPDDAGA